MYIVAQNISFAISLRFNYRLTGLKANTSDTEAAFLDLHLSISNDIVSTKIYDKRDDFDFEIVISHF